MDWLQMTPEIYVPNFDNNRYTDKNYASSAYYSNRYPIGLQCPCSGKVYKTRLSILSHFKTNCHQLWLDELSKESPLAELSELRNTVKSQQIIITTLTNQIEQHKNSF